MLFLVYIADLQLINPGAHRKLLKFVDDSKVLSQINTEDDVARLQDDLVAVFNWANLNHMRWNDLKFQVLRLGPREEIKENTVIFSPDYGEVVEAKPVIKDLGILVDDCVNYESQLYKAVSKTKQKAGWVLRTFSSRYVEFLRTMWRSLVQCHLDYGNILWAPYRGHGEGYKWTLLESTLREYTKKATGLKDNKY